MTTGGAGSGRVLALDVGTRRIGVAVSDPSGTLASPVTTLNRTNAAADARAIAALATEYETGLIVVGLPVALSGREEQAARSVRAYLAELGPLLPGISFELVDERMTTVVATRSAAAAGLDSKRRRSVVDQLAAGVILQSWLDAGRRGTGA
jgi:putative Holliday junction resolvase